MRKSKSKTDSNGATQRPSSAGVAGRMKGFMNSLFGGKKEKAATSAQEPVLVAAQVPKDRTESVSSDQGAPHSETRQRKVSSGFISDVGHAPPPMSKGLVQVHETAGFSTVYDTQHLWKLGQGGCGAVTTVRHKQSNRVYAMKTIKITGMSEENLEVLRQEIEIQRSLDHPNIVKLIESFEDRSHDCFFIVMEMCTGGSLVSSMQKHRYGYGERAAATLAEKMLSAVLYCHQHGYIHRDIKLDNFIYETEAEDAELKLIDFGFACEVRAEDEQMFERLGTLSYMAPELLSPDRRTSYNSSVDMWAIGVVTYMLLSGKRPFHHEERKTKKQMIMHDPLEFRGREWERTSEEAKDFCDQLMQKDPSLRLSASDALKHAFIRDQSTLHVVDAADALVQHREVVESLQSYAKATELKKLALEGIAFSTPPQKMEELRRIFVEMDIDHSGTISRSEFAAAMSKQDIVQPQQVDQIFRAMDLSGSNEIDYSAFISATLSRKASVQAPALAAAFSLLDRDQDGYITEADLLDVVGDTFSRDRVHSMLTSPTVGADNGRLSFEHFRFCMLKDDEVVRNVHKAVSRSRMKKWNSAPGSLTASITSDPELLLPSRESSNPSGEPPRPKSLAESKLGHSSPGWSSNELNEESSTG